LKSLFQVTLHLPSYEQENLKGFYASCGFALVGPSAVVHGGRLMKSDTTDIY